MKKIFTLMFSLIFSCVLLLPAQEIYVQEETTEVAPATNQNTREEYQGQLPTTPFTIKDYSHWSLSVEGGLNYFQGDMVQGASAIFKQPLKHWSLGGNVEYTVNPMYSLGVSYMFGSLFGHDNKAQEGVDRGQFNSTTHHIAPFIGVNLLNFPMFNRNKRWDFWITAGVGAAHYDSELNYKFRPELDLYTKDGRYITEDIWNDPNENIGYSRLTKWTAFIPVGFELSYSITQQFVIGLKYKINFYLTDDMEGGVKLDPTPDKWGRKNYYEGSAGDALSNFLLVLRWDIAPGDKTHIRKLTWREYKAERDPRIDDLARRLDSLENQVASIDLTPIMIPVPGADCNCTQVPLAVYFDFDKTNLDKDALIVLSQVARIMHENPEFTVEVRGYTDVVGTDAYNNRLSQRRADVIKDELVRVFNIAPGRIVANGEGKATEPAPNDRKYHPINRRCDFFFIDNE